MKNLATLFICAITIMTLKAQDIQVTFLSDTLTLNGTLSIPNGMGPFPTVIFVHGSGPNDRDQTAHITGGNASCLYPGIYNDTVRSFRDLANEFRGYGIAVLRYDKRTYTYQTQLDPKEITPHDFIADLHAAVDYVKTRSEVDTNCIMLLGHSQGANFIPIVAKQRNDISTLLALGTAARGIDTIMAMQFRYLYYYCLNDTATGDATYNQTLSDFYQIRTGTWNPNTPYLGAYPKFWQDWINITDSAVINFNAVSQPTLFLHAMEDFNIPLEDAQRYETQLTIGSFNVYYMNGINHFFTTATNPTVAQIVSDTIFYWIEQNQCNTTSVTELTQHNNSFVVFNTGTSIFIKINSDSPVTDLRVFDIQGRLIDTFDTKGKDIIVIQKSKYTKGIYLLTGTIDRQIITKKIMIEN